MKKLNNIDKLAQDKLKNLEIEAPELIWTNIERELRKKKEKKLFPIWWKYAGVAAVLLIGIFIGKEFSSNSEIDITKPNQLEISKPIVQENSNNESNKNNEKQVVVQENENLDKVEKNKTSSSIVVAENKITTKNKESINKTNSNYDENINNNAIANYSKSNDLLNENNQKSENSNSNKNIAFENSSDKNTKSKSNNESSKNTLLENEISVLNNKKSASKNELIDNQKNTIQPKNEIALSEKTELKKDSLPKKPNVLENLLAEKTKKKTKESKSNKWQITPNIAPIYANSTSNNSTLNAKFDNNSKSYENNISLGLAVNYAITKKISIRTGINKFDVSNNTSNIGFYKNPTIALTVKDATAIISNDYTISNNITNQTPEIIQVGTSFIPIQNPTKTEGTLNQKTAYLEVPLEISYAILNKKFGINLIAGFSTLFLNKNQVSIISNNNKIDLGTADNLNKIHYCTNVGLGFNYKFAKSFQVNLEPMLKYQINTFSNDGNNYKPYFVGIYSGISFGF